ncbi:hypothetical protein [Devosia chinhatensis]|uniref:hypothetical protein n=1 Tax=Devosia chinhatensis TaxID=429727 RepID=UPI00128CCBB5|nr:hypothetical protein [Devosia chinhatensis]
MTGPTVADADPGSRQLRVGQTNIFCVQAPCPWRGIAPAEGDRSTPSALLWSDQNLPAVKASNADARRISEAWHADRCLLVDGQMIGATLVVDAILGACP